MPPCAIVEAERVGGNFVMTPTFRFLSFAMAARAARIPAPPLPMISTS